jgi:hypothetical protein
MSSFKEFINTLKDRCFYINEEFFEDLSQFIINSGCPSIRFDYLSLKALGISKPDECVISYKVLDLPTDYMLYVILHEVAHQYQYKKYGKNLVLAVYQNETTIDSAIERLLYYEQQADRLAIKKLNSIVKKNNTKIIVNIIPRYLNINNFDYIRSYIENIRLEVADKNYTTIESINAYLHNRIRLN